MGKAKGLKEGVYPFVPLEFELKSSTTSLRRPTSPLRSVALATTPSTPEGVITHPVK